MLTSVSSLCEVSNNLRFHSRVNTRNFRGT